MNNTILSKIPKNENKTEKYYLTDNIIVKDKKMYVEKEKNNKTILYKINKNNWHKYLNEYGWDKLELSWQKRVKFNYNYPFGFLDCGGGGDCLFSVISEALNLEDIYNNGDGNKYSIESIRGFASNEVINENYESILNFNPRQGDDYLDSGDDNNSEQFNTGDDYFQSLVPILFVRGDKSSYISHKDINFIRLIFKNSFFKTVENAGHWVHSENHHSFMEVVTEFLKDRI